jgi:putative methyltransferase (TIGR04325 family)
MSNFRQFIKLFLPPVIVTIKQRLFPKQQNYSWFGDYKTWEDAAADSTGYENTNILEKVKTTTSILRDNPDLFEYDTILKESTDYNWHILTFLLLVSKENNNNLNIIDYGGGLGNLYFQYRPFLNGANIRWNIIEQPIFVNEGNKSFANNQLRFFNTLEECLEISSVDAIIFSAVIDILERPYELISKIISKNIQNIIFDRVPIQRIYGKDRITILRVYKEAYEAIIPCTIFDEVNFKKQFIDKYILLYEGLSKEKHIGIENELIEKKFLFFKKR